MHGHRNTPRDPLFDIHDKVYLIAGACGGLATPLLDEISARGAKMAFYDINEIGLTELQSKFPDALIFAGSIDCEASITACIVKVIEKFGVLDGMINAAGVLPICDSLSIDYGLFKTCLDVNLNGAFLLSRCVARSMQERGGRIIHIASVSSNVANIDYAAYASSKAALSQLVRVLAREWATKNILVNAIGPALTETKLTREYLSDQHFRQNAIDAIPMQRLGLPSDLFGPIIMLMSKAGLSLPVRLFMSMVGEQLFKTYQRICPILCHLTRYFCLI